MNSIQTQGSAFSPGVWGSKELTPTEYCPPSNEEENNFLETTGRKK